MAYFKIKEPNQKTKFIKDVDRQNEVLTFAESKNGCYNEDEGFYADSAFDFLMFHFKEKYPELEYMTIDTSYSHDDREGAAELAP